MFNKKIVNNKFFDALLKLMLLSAAVHIAVLVFVCISRFDFTPLNYFSVIGLNEVFPGTSEGLLSQILSLFVIISLYCAILLLSNRKK